MDNSGITHNTHLGRMGVRVQSYVETGHIVLDLNGEGLPTIELDTEDAERLVAVLRAALADKEA